MKTREARERGAIAAGERERTGGASWPLATLALSMLLSSLGVSIANVALPDLARAFAAPFPAVQWVVLSYLLAVTVMIVGAGRLGDLAGHRRVLSGGIVVFTMASALCAFAPTLWVLIGARLMQGAGAAVLMALTVALVRDTVPKARTGSAMGLLGTMSAIGTALGPSLGGVLLAGPGWRAVFLVMVPLGLLNFVLARRFLPTSGAAAGGAGFDRAGTLWLALTLAAYALALTVARDLPTRIAILALAALAGAIFLRVEARAPSPLIRLAAFRDRGFGAGLAMNAIVSSVMMATFVVGPFFLARSLGLGPAVVGAVMAVGPVVSAFTGVPAGRLVDRLGASRIVVLGLALMAGGAGGLALLPGLFGVPGYIGAIAMLTPGYQLFQAANNTAVMADVGPDRRGTVSAMLGLSRNLGLVTGASLMGAVFAAATGTADIGGAAPDAVAFGLRVTFAVAAALLALGLALALRNGRGIG